MKSAPILQQESTHPPPVKERIQRRIDLLKSWKENGIPPEYVASLPTTIKQLKEWDIPSLGIYPIKRTNDFTRTSKEFGSLVKDAVDGLEALANTAKPPSKRKSLTKTNDDLHTKVSHLEDLLSRIVGQWNKERKRAEDATATEIYYRGANAELQDQIDERDAEISDLKRQLQSLGRPRLTAVKK